MAQACVECVHTCPLKCNTLSLFSMCAYTCLCSPSFVTVQYWASLQYTEKTVSGMTWGLMQSSNRIQHVRFSHYLFPWWPDEDSFHEGEGIHRPRTIRQTAVTAAAAYSGAWQVFLSVPKLFFFPAHKALDLDLWGCRQSAALGHSLTNNYTSEGNDFETSDSSADIFGFLLVLFLLYLYFFFIIIILLLLLLRPVCVHHSFCVHLWEHVHVYDSMLH